MPLFLVRCLLLVVWHLSTTMHEDDSIIGDNLGWYFEILRPKHLPLSCENKLVFRFSSNLQKHVLLCWQNDGRNPLPSLLFVLHDAFGQRNNDNNNICPICISFTIAQSWCIRLSSKPDGKLKKPLSTSPASFCSSFSKAKLQFFLFLARCLFKKTTVPCVSVGMCQWWQLLQAAKRTSTQSWLAVVKVMTVSLPFNQWEFSIFGEIWNLLFSKDVCSTSIYLRPHRTPTQWRLLFCAGIQFSCDSFHMFNHHMKLWENRGLWTI